MNIQKITFTPHYTYTINNDNKLKNKLNKTNNTVYNPVAYKDYNISFGERLFRTPANFFAQNFNRNNMPQTMKNYLYYNYDDRQNIPPAQMMKIVFDDLNEANNFEEVKEFFPHEPLFFNLKSTDNKKYREGILAELNIMKEPDKSLFKNGKDDLGMYVLRKIYIEGKTLKEINKDFKKDISVYYDGLSDINYHDLANLGIKFPNNSFWHSFIVTREDFPYVPVKRKDAEFHARGSSQKELTLSDINKGDFDDRRPPKYSPKDHEIKDITGAVLEDFGDRDKTNKNLKRKLKSDDPKLTFIQQYMGEIMSISLDRVHASEEMTNFFENYDNLDKSSRLRMKKYWDSTPEMKALQGLVMSDTIKYFFEAYGADGNNELFKDLIDYAHSIKPEREKAKILHDENQKMYDEIFADYSPELKSQEASDDDIDAEMEKLHEEIQKAKEYFDSHKYTYKIGLHNVNLQDSIENMIKEYNLVKMDDYLPVSYINKYTQFLKEHPDSNDKFLLSVILYDTKNNANEELLKELYPSDIAAETLKNIQISFMRKYLPETRAAQQALISVVSNRISNDSDKSNLSLLYNLYPLQVADYKDIVKIDMSGSKDELSRYYALYRKPVTSAEAQKITNKLIELLRRYDASNSHLSNYGFESKKEIDMIFNLQKIFNKSKNQTQRTLKELIIKSIANYGGSSRAIVDPNSPDSIQFSLMEDIVLSILYHNPSLNRQLEMMSRI